jgi:RNA polymerase sigma factor (sigma-70 family)
MPADSAAVIETVFRIEFPKLVAGLARHVDDIGLAEEAAQDALVDALRQWPREGTPRNPGAWLMTVAKRRAIDRIRRDHVLEAKRALIACALDSGDAVFLEDSTDDDIGDDRLRLMFVACHPVLPVPARVALTLRLLGGLTTAEIARAYLQPEPTVAQRIVRAKKTIARAGVPFEVPTAGDRAVRLGSVLEVIYLIFNEGYSATAGDTWLRADLCAEALRLGRLLAALTPEEPEVHGLLALIEIQSSRLEARVGAAGEPVLLLDQDRRKWDRLLIHRGLSSLEQAQRLQDVPGSYTLQAAIAACHARAVRVEDTDWGQLVNLYGRLASATPSPIVELNRAVAISMCSGPREALRLVDQLRDTHTLDRYHLLHSVRGDLLTRLNRHAEAQTEFELAASLASNHQEQQLSRKRALAAAQQATIDPPRERFDQSTITPNTPILSHQDNPTPRASNLLSSATPRSLDRPA